MNPQKPAIKELKEQASKLEDAGARETMLYALEQLERGHQVLERSNQRKKQRAVRKLGETRGGAREGAGAKHKMGDEAMSERVFFALTPSHAARLEAEAQEGESRNQAARRLLCSLGRYEEGLQEVERALRLTSDAILAIQIQRNKAICLLELHRFKETQEVLEDLPVFGVEWLLFLMRVSMGLIDEAVHALLAPSQDSGDLKLPLEGGLNRLAPGSLRDVLLPLLQFVVWGIQEGHSPEQILRSLDPPPDELTPGTPEYIDWWHQELHDPGWSGGVRETLELLSVPGMRERLLEARAEPKEERLSLEELHQMMA